MPSEQGIFCLLKGNYQEAKGLIKQEDYPLELAYAYFLSGGISQALKILSLIDCTRANWLRELINLVVTSKMQNVTYFQIRNFVELDIDLFINSKRIDYLEKLFAYSSKLSEVNSETYKLIGRVLFNSNLFSLAKYYLDLYKNIVYYDPELHFLYAKFYLLDGNYELALSSINSCLNSLPAYYPAKKLRNEIEERINSSNIFQK